ncbi:hypothetical protein ABT040_11320 [Streptomyces sp. NPDC002688]|uniref:hypothetical protein n=1 Tax=Streptomyces sp. NPDC002688 TaxID=3154423 RepID=UPI003319CDFE
MKFTQDSNGAWLLSSDKADTEDGPTPTTQVGDMDAADGTDDGGGAPDEDDALNSRSVTGLIQVGGVKGEGWSRKEAARILAERGGKEWKVKDVRIDYDMGPDTGSAELLAEGKAGGSLRDTFTATREKGVWHLAFFTHQPGGGSKESSSTDKPGS